MRVDPAFDAGRRRAGVVGISAARGLEGSDGIHGRRRQAILFGVPLRVEVPAEVGARDEQEKNDEEDPAAVHRVGIARVRVWERLGVRMREAACEARMGEPDTVVGATLGADADGISARQQALNMRVCNNATKGDTEIVRCW